MLTSAKRFTANQRKRIIAAADVAPNTLIRYVKGRPIREASRNRIEQAIKALEGGANV